MAGVLQSFILVPMLFSHKIKCNTEPPSKTNYSSSSKIKCLLETNSVMSLVMSDFSGFCI